MHLYAIAADPPLGGVLIPLLVSCLWQQAGEAVQLLDMASLQCMVGEKPIGLPLMQMVLADLTSSRCAPACICEHCAGD